MRVTISYELPEESDDVGQILFVRDAFSALWDIKMACRKHWKYNEDPKKVLDEIMELIPDDILERFYT